ncbi:MAG TPA: lipoprotein [Rhodocyclaceae bacterium]|nr:lipoprotein [Rhodocyclaceae bacterium]
MMRLTTLALSLLAAAFVGACGLKGDLYLPPPAAKQPSAAPAAPQSATSTTAPAAKGGDDSKAAQPAPAAK